MSEIKRNVELSENAKIAIDTLFTNGFDRPNAYAAGFPTSTKKSRASQMYQLLKRPTAKAYYDEKYKEFKELLGVDKTTLVASLIKQVEFFAEVMHMASEGCPIEDKLGNEIAREEWFARYGRMKDVMSAAENNKAKEMIAKLIGAFEPEKIEVTEKTFKVGFDFGNDIKDAEIVE